MSSQITGYFSCILLLSSLSYGGSHTCIQAPDGASCVSQPELDTLKSMDSFIDACSWLNKKGDNQISDSELGILSAHLNSWSLALEVRRACQLLLQDPLLSKIRIPPKNSASAHNKFSYYVINLAKSKDRLDAMSMQFKNAGLGFTRIDAVYGKELSLIDLKNTGFYNPAPYPQRYLKPAEVGIYLSQRKAWKQIIQDKTEYGVVFEDDVEIPKDLAKKVDHLVRRAPKEWSIIYLSCNSQNKDKFFEPCWPENLEKVPNAPLTKLNNKCVAGGWAYVVNRKGAQKLLNNTLPIEWPIDYAIKNNFVGAQQHGQFKAYCASPEIAKTGAGGSVIGDRGNCKDIACTD